MNCHCLELGNDHTTLLCLVLPSVPPSSLLKHWLSHRNASPNGSGRQCWLHLNLDFWPLRVSAVMSRCSLGKSHVGESLICGVPQAGARFGWAAFVADPTPIRHEMLCCRRNFTDSSSAAAETDARLLRFLTSSHSILTSKKDRAIANTMSSGQSERTPLLHGRSPSGLASSQPPGQILGDRADTEGPFDDEELAQESHFSAIQDAQNTVDAQASAFLPEGSYFSVHQATGGHQSQLAAVEEAATPSAPERSKSEVILILAALWIGTFLAAADGSIVATILASVGSEFKASKEVDWIGTSYLLSTCSFQPLYGRGADIFVSAKHSSLAEEC